MCCALFFLVPLFWPMRILFELPLSQFSDYFHGTSWALPSPFRAVQVGRRGHLDRPASPFSQAVTGVTSFQEPDYLQAPSMVLSKGHLRFFFVLQGARGQFRGLYANELSSSTYCRFFFLPPFLRTSGWAFSVFRHALLTELGHALESFLALSLFFPVCQVFIKNLRSSVFLFLLLPSLLPCVLATMVQQVSSLLGN